jgi:hypothetical protein
MPCGSSSSGLAGALLGLRDRMRTLSDARVRGILVGTVTVLVFGRGPGTFDDLLWFHFGQQAWFTLVGDRGWTFDQAECWLAESAKHALYGPRRAGPR